MHRTFFFPTLAFASLALGSGFFALPAQAAAVPDLQITAGSYRETLSGNTLSAWLRFDTARRFERAYTTEIEDPNFCAASYRFCDFSLPYDARYHFKSVLVPSVDESKLQSFLADLATKTDKEPQDAIFAGDANGKVIVATPDMPGQSLDIAASGDILRRAIAASSGQKTVAVTLPVRESPAEITAADQERLGLKELIGEGTTNFKGSPKNRIYNIKRALEQFQGVIVQPDEEFSFVKYLGDVDAEHGYLPELVIKNNKTEPEFGGGICQVSTTVFRAAIYSGMKITERRNHAYPVRYYLPYGMDATIYIPKPDFRFTNNTGHAIFMQSHIEGDTLTFRFFGTSDGRQVSVDGPHILESNPDGSMKTVFTQIVKKADGSDMIRDQFWSNYKSPSLYPHPGEEQPKLTSKPKDWSVRQWKEYKKLNP